MALGEYYCPGELDTLHQDRNRSETTLCLPSPAKRTSTYYPKAGPQVLEESNPDPFYLEQSLAATPTWDDSFDSTIRNESYKDPSQYCTLSLNGTHSSRQRPGPDRSNIVEIELEKNSSFHRYTSSTEEQRPLHSSQGSFSSVRTGSTTPDLSPSSSFSSACSSPACPDAVLKATEKLFKHASKTQGEHSPRRFYLPVPAPPQYSLPVPQPTPSLPKATAQPTASITKTANNSSSRITMKYESSSMSSSRRRKQHPTLNLSRGTSTHSCRRKQSSPGTRPPLDPSMISPPCLINPVTMEPHATHFDQALFIPANDCPSPLPSPSTSSPPISRQWTATSMERPSTSTMDAYFEQSVWESDSDNESIGHRSLSRKPIETLRKARSRAKLRAAKSQPKLQPAMTDDQASEKFPSMPDDAIGEPIPEPFRGMSLDRPSTSRDGLRPHHPLQTLRLVAPSTASLIKSRSRNNSIPRSPDVDRSMASVFQSRTKPQRSASPESIHPDKEKLTSMCYEQHPPATFHEPMSQPRPLLKRVIESFRLFNCHKTRKNVDVI